MAITISRTATINESGGRRARLIALVVFIALAVSYTAYWLSRPGLAEQGNARNFLCVESNKPFEHVLEAGEIEPITSPFTGRKTGWMAEACYWTRDGKAKKTPTLVVERRRMGLEGETICPDCGRRVVGHNPRPPKELMDAAE